MWALEFRDINCTNWLEIKTSAWSNIKSIINHNKIMSLIIPVCQLNLPPTGLVLKIKYVIEGPPILISKPITYLSNTFISYLLSSYGHKVHKGESRARHIVRPSASSFSFIFIPVMLQFPMSCCTYLHTSSQCLFGSTAFRIS